MRKYIDADKLREIMYHEAFETDTEMQRWDSGCWIRYKMFENALEQMPSADVVSQGVVDQIKWERDMAISQLEEVGKGLGSKMDDVAEVRHGRWERVGDVTYRCSVCGEISCCNSLFCGDCGAKMDGEQNDQ